MNADGFFVANAAERDHVAASIGAERVCELPFGLLDAHRRELNDVAHRRAAGSPPHVTFVGTWDARKGKYDFAEIIRSVTAEMPDARFTFLGTYSNRERVLADLGGTRASHITVHPSFQPAALPALLAPGTAAAFPSYLEGFGFAVIEQLAAGLPVVAYDVPGPRDILAALSPELLVPRGDTQTFALRLVQALRGDLVSPEACIARASDFRWPAIAERTIHAYRAWAELRCL
jgi:glycosyltransferase involved in cell wall biosynthesis